MDIYFKTEDLERAATSAQALINQIGDAQDTLARARELVENGAWTGQPADRFLQRFNNDLAWLFTYAGVLMQFKAELDGAVDQLNSTDGYLRQAMPG